MLTVTDNATEQLSNILTNAEAPQDVAMRLVRSEEGLSIQMDNERPGDNTFDHEGRTVLLLDEEVTNLLGARTLDVESTDDGPRLALR